MRVFMCAVFPLVVCRFRQSGAGLVIGCSSQVCNRNEWPSACCLAVNQIAADDAKEVVGTEDFGAMYLKSYALGDHDDQIMAGVAWGTAHVAPGPHYIKLRIDPTKYGKPVSAGPTIRAHINDASSLVAAAFADSDEDGDLDDDMRDDGSVLDDGFQKGPLVNESGSRSPGGIVATTGPVAKKPQYQSLKTLSLKTLARCKGNPAHIAAAYAALTALNIDMDQADWEVAEQSGTGWNLGDVPKARQNEKTMTHAGDRRAFRRKQSGGQGRDSKRRRLATTRTGDPQSINSQSIN